MKAKLLKNIRSRYEMTYDPNIGEDGYPYKLVIRYNWNNDNTTHSFKTKEEMFEFYRESVIYLCGRLYCKYPRDKSKPIKIIKHCEL
jgi:hypothetical protein